MKILKVIILPEHHKQHDKPHIATAGLECHIQARASVCGTEMADAIFTRPNLIHGEESAVKTNVKHIGFPVQRKDGGDWVSYDDKFYFNPRSN